MACSSQGAHTAEVQAADAWLEGDLWAAAEPAQEVEVCLIGGGLDKRDPVAGSNVVDGTIAAAVVAWWGWGERNNKK